MLSHTNQIRVRYAEVDQMGYLHHAKYAVYFEEGRTEMIRQLGLSYKDMEERGTLLPVSELKTKFIMPALYDDLLKLKTTLADFSGVRLTFKYELVNQENELLASGESVLVFVDSKTRRPTRAPQYFLDAVSDKLPK